MKVVLNAGLAPGEVSGHCLTIGKINGHMGRDVKKLTNLLPVGGLEHLSYWRVRSFCSELVFFLVCFCLVVFSIFLTFLLLCFSAILLFYYLFLAAFCVASQLLCFCSSSLFCLLALLLTCLLLLSWALQ